MTIGSTPPHGTAPCVCRPVIVMVNSSALAMFDVRVSCIPSSGC